MSVLCNQKNILVVGALCVQCGACGVMCPQHAIAFEPDENGNFFPTVDRERCTYCGLCLQVCPALELDVSKLYGEVFFSPPINPFVGHWISCWAGYAADPETRFKASSGGIVTALLRYALQQNIISGALVVRLQGFLPQPFIARTYKGIEEGMGSKYLPVAPLVALSEVLTNEDQRIAVVGLPCQIEGVRKLLALSGLLSNRIGLLIGVFCNHTKNLKYTDFLLQRLRQNRETVHQIQYRGYGWPGETRVTIKDGTTYSISQASDSIAFMWYTKAYAPSRCLVCTDHLAEFADISVGDAWLPEYKESDNLGTSLVISRTEWGQQVLGMALSDRAVCLFPLPIDRVLQSQPNVVEGKKVSYRNSLVFLLSWCYREFKLLEGIDEGKRAIFSRSGLLALFRLIIWRAFSSRLFSAIAPRMPEQAFKILRALLWRVEKIFSR